MSLSDKLVLLNNEKLSLKTGFEGLGFDMASTPFTSYHTLIRDLLTGLVGDYYVSSVWGKDSNDGLSPLSPFLTLSKAVTSASEGQSIVVMSGIYKGVDNCDFQISKSVTIIGEPSTFFDGETVRRSGWTMNYPNSMTVKGLSFINGNSNGGNSGAIDSYTTGNTLIDCSFINNIGSQGGAVYLRSFNASNCSFINNSAKYGGAIYLSGDSSIISDCSFINNSSNMDGGAVYNHGKSNSVKNNNFTNNLSNRHGGAVYNISLGTVTNCTFTGNNAISTGGAVYNHMGNTISNSTFTSNISNGDGGGVYNYGASAGYDGNTISSCTFTDNTSKSNGGGIYNKYTGNIINDSTFTGNSATSLGGTIYNCGANTLNNNDLLTLIGSYIYNELTGTVIDNTYWNTSTPTSTDYYSTLNDCIPTNNRSSPNHPERLKTSTLTLSVDNTSISSGSNLVLTGTLKDLNGDIISNANVNFYKDDTLIGTSKTDTSGLASFTYTTTSTGTCVFKADYEAKSYIGSTSQNITVTVT